MFGKAKIQNSNIIVKAKIQNCNVSKSQNQFYLEISSVNTRRDNISIGAIGFEQVSMAVENASKTLVTNTVSMTCKHITVNRALG